MRHSARVQAATEDEVRRRRESLQRLLDSAAEGLYGVDTQGRCTFINRSALAMLGYERESDLLGREMDSLIHRPPNGVQAADSRIARAYRESRELHVAGELLWRRDGSSFPVEYWSHPMRDDGVLQGSVATFFDITERLHMQAALRQGEVRMTGLVDAVNDGVITIDAEGKVVLFNRAAERLFGAPATEAIGGSVDRFIPRHPRTPEAARTQQLQVGDVHSGEVRELFGRRADGQEFPLEVSLSRHETERGPLLTAVLRDVTGLQTARAERQAREALEASSRAKTEFLSRMSHELRTPLNAVLGFSQLLRLDTAEPPSLQQLARIQHIENAGAHLLALVNDVLDLSRVESGQMTVTLESVDLRSSVEDALTMVLPLATSVGVRTWISGLEGGFGSRGEVAGDDIFVRADRVRLRQVLVNLLSNAVKYNRPGGQVRVSWQVEDDRCALRIADDGIGMAPEKLERLFEPFNRLGAENSKIEGTGIGLVLSRRLVELMRGELRIESALGRGTEASLIARLRRRGAGADRRRLAAEPARHARRIAARPLCRGQRGQHRDRPRGGQAAALGRPRRGRERRAGVQEGAPRPAAADPGRHEPGRHDRHRAGTGLARGPGHLGNPPGRPVGGRPARADRCGACHGIRGLPDQADQLPRSARCAGRAAFALTLGFRKHIPPHRIGP